MTTQIAELQFSTGLTLTETLVKDGAPPLPAGFTYRLDIKHPTLTDGRPERAANVTARIGHLIGDEWLEVARFTEVTRVHLNMAAVAAAGHAYEVWGI